MPSTQNGNFLKNKAKIRIQEKKPATKFPEPIFSFPQLDLSIWTAQVQKEEE